MNLNQDFEKLFHRIIDSDFINMEALGGEIPFYIYTYDPQREIDTKNSLKLLKQRIIANGKNICEIKLYHLAMKMLEQRNLLKKIIQMEKSGDLSKQNLLNSLDNILAIDKKLREKIEKIIYQNSPDLIFLTEIGQVYPYIRTKQLLEILQTLEKNIPLICFYPGKYDRKYLSLFGKLKSRHYRAFNLNDLIK